MIRRVVAWVLTVVLVAGLAGAAWVWHDVTQLRTVPLTVRTEKLPHGAELRVVQVSDFHNGRGPRVGHVLRAVERARPDLVVLTGDLVNTTDPDWRPLEELLRGLARVGVPRFAVWGNHDHWSQRLEDLRGVLERHQVTLLVNEHRSIAVAGHRLTVVGVDDPATGRDDLPRATRGVDPRRWSLLLAHSPEIRDALPASSMDLTVVGHTHGGQVRVPFKGCVVAPNQGLWPRYCRGLHDIGGRQLWIDSGVGWTSRPVRWRVPSQITVVTVRGR